MGASQGLQAALLDEEKSWLERYKEKVVEIAKTGVMPKRLENLLGAPVPPPPRDLPALR